MVVPVNPVYTSREIAHILGDSGACMVLAHQDWTPRLEEIEPGAIQVRTVLTRQGGQSLEQALDRACPQAPEAWRPPELDPDEPVLTFTPRAPPASPRG